VVGLHASSGERGDADQILDEEPAELHLPLCARRACVA
jgi:hypothetical protein